MIDESKLTGWQLVFAWLLLCIATGLIWWAMAEYVFFPTLHMLGGMFRLFALR